MHGKTMREALQEARDYRDDTNEGGPGSGPQKGGKKQSSANIKKAYGILNDPRFKQGNYSGAAKAIDKLSPGLSNHPDVKNAMKRANEELEEANRYSVALKGDAKKLFDLSWKAGSKSKAYGDKEWDAAVDDTAKKYRNDNHIRISDKDIAAVKKAVQYNEFDPSTNEELDLSATGDTTTSNASQENKIVEKIIPGQLARLKKEWEPLRKVDMSKHQKTIDQIKVKLKRLNPSSLSQIVRADIFMVSDIAKKLMKEEIDEAVVGLPFSRTLMYIIKTDRNTAKKIKSFLADNGEKYPIHIDDNGSGQITLDAYNYTGGEKKAALAAAQAIAKKFNVKVNATR